MFYTNYFSLTDGIIIVSGDLSSLTNRIRDHRRDMPMTINGQRAIFARDTRCVVTLVSGHQYFLLDARLYCVMNRGIRSFLIYRFFFLKQRFYIMFRG